MRDRNINGKLISEHSIEGTSFYVDLAKDEIREIANPQNRIPFSEMAYTGSGYTFSYDRTTRNLPSLFDGNGDIVSVTLPQKVVLNPEGMAEKYGIGVDDVRKKTDLDFVVDKELVAKREMGVLPTIYIAGYDFTIDLRLNELRPVTDPAYAIHLDDPRIGFDDGSNKYQALFHITSHHLADIDPATITELPRGVVLVEIPSDKELDPIGWARKYDCEKLDTLIHCPIRKDLAANVIPLSKTALPALIAKNRRALKKTGADLMSKNRRKPGKGRRL